MSLQRRSIDKMFRDNFSGDEPLKVAVGEVADVVRLLTQTSLL